MRQLLLVLAMVTLAAPALAQQQQGASPMAEVIATVSQIGMQIGAQMERQNAANEAQKATLIEWLKAAQEKK